LFPFSDNAVPPELSSVTFPALEFAFTVTEVRLDTVDARLA
jgi:hypothetical protein